MKIKLVIFWVFSFTLMKSQGVFIWKTHEDKPSTITWDVSGFSTLYKYDGSSVGYQYLLMINSDAVTSFNLVQGEGAYTRVFLPPGVSKITFGHNDPTLNASQCVKYSFIGEFALNENIPIQTSGSESWNWGCGAFNSTYIRDPNNINTESVLIAGYYNEDNQHYEGVNFQDYSIIYYVSDSIIYNNWLEEATSTETIGTEPIFSIYPNPAEDFVIVNSTDLNVQNIQLLDITGKVIYCPSESIGGAVKFDISKLKSGMFFIKNNIKVEKFIKR